MNLNTVNLRTQNVDHPAKAKCSLKIPYSFTSARLRIRVCFLLPGRNEERSYESKLNTTQIISFAIIAAAAVIPLQRLCVPLSASL